jgi:hypothetical protein
VDGYSMGEIARHLRKSDAWVSARLNELRMELAAQGERPPDG